MLEELGLSQSADAVYRAMLADPLLGVGDLVRLLGITEREVRSGLDELVRSSLVRESRDEPGRLRAVSPDVGFNQLLRLQEVELLRKQQALADRKAALAKAVADYSGLQPNALDSSVSQRLLGLDAIQAQLEVLARGLEFECLSVMPGGAQSAKSLEASRPLDRDAMERGVDLLTLYQDSARNDAATYAYARWMTTLHGQVRTAPLLPPRMVIFDQKVAVIPIDPDNTRLGALCTREPAIVASLVAIFELAWSTSVPFGAETPVQSESGLSAVDKELLKLLAGGLTDEAAGNRLGVSARTVRRQMAVLMERLGATSRFEAGLKAAQRGWL
jgi:DNA-binding CsgD family transcriptional regulator/sugar-specific transcriptional regulator TrmB